MTDFIAALGLVLVIEGIAFAAFPAATKRAMTVMLESSESQLRTAGIAAAILGIIVVWLTRA
jgi:uncharacterized protein YjeT (DUF2065 family)